MRLAWVTDIHLNFLTDTQVDAFLDAIAQDAPDGVLVGGDIAEAPSVGPFLQRLEDRLAQPIWFVLGNHDFYRGSIAAVRAAMTTLSRETRWLRWLNVAGVVALTPESALVGHDGWGDGRLGDFVGSTVRLSDFVFIDELAGLDRTTRGARLAALGDEAGAHFATMLPIALARYAHVVVLTHVPPFRDACWHEGQISDDEWLPFFTCHAAGQAIAAAARAFPHRQITVLCGHTHGAGEAQILPNLRVRTGGARYGAPAVQPAVVVP